MDVGSVVAAQLAEARRVWPALQLDAEVYAAFVRATLAVRASEPAERVLQTLPLDLVLAAACASGDERAIAIVRAELGPGLRHALARTGAPGAVVDETEQRVWIMLFVGAAAQIRQYSGRGRLRSWIRSIGVRTIRRMLGAEHGSASDERELSQLPAAVRDPELEAMRARYAPEVKRALAQALTELTPRQRNVLRQYHIDGLTIDQLAVLYKINRATAARWVAGARLALVTATRARLVAELQLDSREVDSVIRLVRSLISISVRELA
jgi:RNA polymerase sigma-70 factor (ECF subfamily)